MIKKNVVLRVIVGAVIFEKKKILLLQRNVDEKTYPNLWELPSGKKNPLERTTDALVREVREETGLVVTKADPFHVFDYKIEKPLEIRDSVQINYLTSVADPKMVTISREHQSFVWVSMEEISKHGVTDSTKETIKKAFELRALK